MLVVQLEDKIHVGEGGQKVCLDGCSSVGKVAQWRPGGHGFNACIPQWHLVK